MKIRLVMLILLFLLPFAGCGGPAEKAGEKLDEQVADARKQVNELQEQIKDDRQEIKETRKEIADLQQQLQAAKQELEQARQERQQILQRMGTTGEPGQAAPPAGGPGQQ